MRCALDYYAALTPEALDAHTAEERHQLYKMLKLKASASQNGSVKVNGVFGVSFSICESELAPPCTTRSTKGFEIEFRALLTDGAQEVVRFERVAVGST